MADLRIVKNNDPVTEGKKIYYCLAGKLELAIPSINIIKEEDGIIYAAEIYVIGTRPSQFVPNQIEISLNPMKGANGDVKVQYNLLLEMHETDPVYKLVVESLSGIVKPH